MRLIKRTLEFFASAKSFGRASVRGSASALALFAIVAAWPSDSALANTTSVGIAPAADRLIIRLINADTGRPMSHQNVLVEWDDDAEESIIFVGGQGRGTMQLLDRASLTLRPGVKNYGDPNRLAFFSCSGPMIAVPVQQARQQGFVAHNECNERTVEVNPGEIVFWARPLPLWKPDFQ